MLLSVWNGLPHLSESIDSVLSQDDVDLELLVVDDGSSDGSGDLLGRLRDPRVRVLASSPRAGLYRNLNRLLDAASAPLVRLWAQDDIMLPGCLARSVAFHGAHDDVAVAYCGAMVMDPTGKVHQPPDEHTPAILPPDEAAWFMLLHGSLGGNVSALSARTGRLRALGGFATHIAGDFDLIERASRAAPLGHIGQAGVVVRVHDRQWSRAEGADLETLRCAAPVWRAILARVADRGAGGDRARARSLLAEGIARANGGAILRALLSGRGSQARRVLEELSDLVHWHEWPWHDLRRRFGLRRRLA